MVAPPGVGRCGVRSHHRRGMADFPPTRPSALLGRPTPGPRTRSDGARTSVAGRAKGPGSRNRRGLAAPPVGDHVSSTGPRRRRRGFDFCGGDRAARQLEHGRPRWSSHSSVPSSSHGTSGPPGQAGVPPRRASASSQCTDPVLAGPDEGPASPFDTVTYRRPGHRHSVAAVSAPPRAGAAADDSQTQRAARIRTPIRFSAFDPNVPAVTRSPGPATDVWPAPITWMPIPRPAQRRGSPRGQALPGAADPKAHAS